MDDDMNDGSNSVRTNGALHAEGLLHNDLNSLNAVVKEKRENGPCGHVKFQRTN